MSTRGQEEKRYDPKDKTLKFVNRPDDLDPYQDGPTAEMSCGHAVTPESLTGWCRALLDQGDRVFRCPASKEGKKCGAVWPYQEVSKMAMLTAEEKQYFQKNIARLAATEYCEVKTCPGCQTFVEREDLTNLNVQCTICTAEKKKTYQFCWQCLKEWKGPAPRSDHCDNDGCIKYSRLEVLKNCETTTLPQVPGVYACPSIRACPTCGQRVEHDKKGCKHITCPRCRIRFCFVCLKLTHECMKMSPYSTICIGGVAPRQTSIPVWRRGSQTNLHTHVVQKMKQYP